MSHQVVRTYYCGRKGTREGRTVLCLIHDAINSMTPKEIYGLVYKLHSEIDSCVR